MIHLRRDCLAFQLDGGGSIPCSVESVAVDLVGEVGSTIDPEMIGHAASAVLHYFKAELGRESVTVDEFSLVLERVLRGLGCWVEAEGAPGPAGRMVRSDLQRLAAELGEGMELALFARLREELRRSLQQPAHLFLFTGLKPCVKRILGAKRWNAPCRRLRDQVVKYLRDCLATEALGRNWSLIVQ